MRRVRIRFRVSSNEITLFQTFIPSFYIRTIHVFDVDFNWIAFQMQTFVWHRIRVILIALFMKCLKTKCRILNSFRFVSFWECYYDSIRENFVSQTLWITSVFLHRQLKYKWPGQYGVWYFIKHRSMVDWERKKCICNILLIKWTKIIINYRGFYGRTEQAFLRGFYINFIVSWTLCKTIDKRKTHKISRTAHSHLLFLLRL